MKAENINGKVVITNETDQEALETFNHFLDGFQFGPLDANEARDWDIKAGMTNAELYQLASDYANEAHTEMCAWKNRENDPSYHDIAREL